MRIQHNIMAMNAYRNYSTNTSALSKNLEKLSSGYKINRAGDDAAGLAISEKMRAQITGLETAQKNAKDGISLVQTAEGALQEVHDMLNRMVELATQSANGTYDNEVDRANLQKEVDQLKSEINRIADSANFNGIKLLDGAMANDAAGGMTDVSVTGTVTAMAGNAAQKGVFEVDLSSLKITNSSTATETVTISIGNLNLTVTVASGETLTGDQILAKINTASLTGATLATNGATFNGTVSGGKLTFEMANNPLAGATGASLQTDFTVSIQGGTSVTNNGQFNAGSQTITSALAPKQDRVAQGTFDLTGVKDGKTITIGDTTYTFAVGADSKYKNAANVIDMTKFTGNESNIDELGADALTKAAANNSMVSVGNSNGNTITITEREGAIDHDKYDLTTTGGWAGFIKEGDAGAGAGSGLTLQIGDTSDSYNQLNLSIQDMHTGSLGISGVDISTQQGAQDAIDVIKNAINTVSSVRGDLGATQNRLDHTINNLSVMTENIQDAESTIRDTDVAEEMMSYTKNNILVQSAQAMLAQANQVPQGVLQLLQ